MLAKKIAIILSGIAAILFFVAFIVHYVKYESIAIKYPLWGMLFVLVVISLKKWFKA
ncbi:hypothetical protein [Rhodocaloribacter sp.]